jgi:arginine-tRNA-protein transferase
VDRVGAPSPAFVVVSQETYDCPYLPGQTALTPLRLPRVPVGRAQFDRLLAEGDRRAGVLLYRTECPTCRACEPLRVPVSQFSPTKSQRRVLRRNDADVRVEVVSPRDSADRVALYNRHRSERGLAREREPITAEEYRFQYVATCVETREIDYLVGDRLVAVSLLDVGLTGASSVYHYFDPAESHRSLGVYSVLAEIALCKQWGLDWYYLGLWVGDCKSLKYKSQYYPHERYRDGQWKLYREPDTD